MLAVVLQPEDIPAGAVEVPLQLEPLPRAEAAAVAEAKLLCANPRLLGEQARRLPTCELAGVHPLRDALDLPVFPMGGGQEGFSSLSALPPKMSALAAAGRLSSWMLPSIRSRLPI